jgi:hypothetical protein
MGSKDRIDPEEIEMFFRTTRVQDLKHERNWREFPFLCRLPIRWSTQTTIQISRETHFRTFMDWSIMQTIMKPMNGNCFFHLISREGEWVEQVDVVAKETNPTILDALLVLEERGVDFRYIVDVMRHTTDIDGNVQQCTTIFVSIILDNEKFIETFKRAKKIRKEYEAMRDTAA